MFLLSLLACKPSVDSATYINDALDDAADETGVPRDLLAGIAWTATRFDNRAGTPSLDEAVGVMNLHLDDRAPSAAEAARLIGEDAETLAQDDAASIRGSAALLQWKADQYLAMTGNRVDTWQEWYAVTAWFSGASDPLVAEGFADQVYDWIQFGLVAESPMGELVEVSPVSMPWRRTAVSGSGLVDQFVAASTSNYSDYSRSGGDITTVVIHDTEGSYSGAISWFQNSAAQASAHYVVRSSDGEITQMIQEEDVAWHAGDWNTNLHSIGIEHEGYASDPGTWYTDAMYEQSAMLTADICDRYGIPKDRTHIIGHFEVPGCSSGHGGGSSCHTDPGDGWDWDKYMALVTGSSGSTTAPTTGSSTDGTRSGTFKGTITSARYGETDTCTGALTGAVNNGQVYLTGTCTLQNHPDVSGDVPVTWSGTVSGGVFSGRMTVDGHSAEFTGAEATDGTISARFSASQDIGGDVGELSVDVEINAS